ncbi:MAG: MFS transporter [Desulfobacterales bacterium]|nr:MFS transporter [Desulfobacterales bacterium]MCP4163187.1 MFS transporter [Deltaproteobacteria bacterium]
MNKWVVFILVATGVFMSTLDGSIVNIALPSIMKDLKTSVPVIEWVIAIYLLTVSSLLLSFGRLSDIKGRRVVYSTGLIFFSLGSFFCGISPSAEFLIFSRSIQGLGAAMVMACTPALIVDTFPVEERGKALGMIGATVASGLTAGPALGGLILHYFSWRLIFYINVPIGLITAFLVFTKLKGSKTDSKQEEPFDFKGSILITLSLILFILFITKSNLLQGINIKGGVLLIIFVLSVYALIRFENQNMYPVLNTMMFRNKLFTLPIISAVLLFTCLFITIFLMPFYLMYPMKFSPGKAGFFMVIPFFFMFVISPYSGTLAGKKGSKILCTTGMFIITLSLYMISQLNISSSYYNIAAGMSLLGIGIALFSSPNTVTVMESVSPNERGVAGGIVATARNLGMVLGVTIGGTVFNHVFFIKSSGKVLENYNPFLENAFFTAFKCSVLTGCLIAMVGIIISWLRGGKIKRV